MGKRGKSETGRTRRVLLITFISLSVAIYLISFCASRRVMSLLSRFVFIVLASLFLFLFALFPPPFLRAVVVVLDGPAVFRVGLLPRVLNVANPGGTGCSKLQGSKVHSKKVHLTL